MTLVVQLQLQLTKDEDDMTSEHVDAIDRDARRRPMVLIGVPATDRVAILKRFTVYRLILAVRVSSVCCIMELSSVCGHGCISKRSAAPERASFARATSRFR